MEDLKPRILRRKATMERLMASKENLEAQINRDRIPKIDARTIQSGCQMCKEF